MKSISAHITSFYHSTFHAYTTEVNVDGHRWRLGLRYSKFHEFYDQLVLKDKDARGLPLPPKGTLFFTPKPEERQQQLEEFLQQVLAYYVAKGCPADVEDLLCDLLKVPQHLREPEHEDDDNVSTSTESVLSEPVHEPATESVAVEKAVEQPKAAAVTVDPVVESKPEPEAAETAVQEDNAPTAEKEEAVEEQPAAVEEPRPAEEAQQPAVTEDAEVATTPVPAEEAEAAPEAVEDEAPAEEKAAPVEEPETADQDVVEAPLEAEEDVKESISVVPAEEQPAGEPVTHEPEVAPPKEDPVAPAPTLEITLEQSAELPAEAAPEKVAAKEEAVESKELSTRGPMSWLTAYLPKSLLGFFRHRAMKKTNLVMLCVAILLPMVLARR